MNPRPSATHAWGVAERVAFPADALLFGQLPPAVLEQVAAHFHLKRVPRSGFVFLEGTPAASLNVLAQGRVKVIRETEEGPEGHPAPDPAGRDLRWRGRLGRADLSGQRTGTGGRGRPAAACREFQHGLSDEHVPKGSTRFARADTRDAAAASE
jgi:hypothetical protein